mmetsp:Transcript_18679/g.36566  ORF Transcript_18679/g.36566 Transcript_18679/m.36566 type:complete len:236 (-) Transcript_18679:575-1282(-)
MHTDFDVDVLHSYLSYRLLHADGKVGDDLAVLVWVVRQTASTHQVHIPYGLHLVDAVVVCERIEVGEEAVQKAYEVVRGHCCAVRVEIADMREQHSNRWVFLCDQGSTLPELPDNVSGQHLDQQSLRQPHLLCDQLVAEEIPPQAALLQIADHTNMHSLRYHKQQTLDHILVQPILASAHVERQHSRYGVPDGNRPHDKQRQAEGQDELVDSEHGQHQQNVPGDRADSDAVDTPS